MPEGSLLFLCVANSARRQMAELLQSAPIGPYPIPPARMRRSARTTCWRAFAPRATS